jgi:light-regulated signal transduction histidine kinase (bacteriophytochrome)
MQRMINELLNYSRVGRRNAEFAEMETRAVAEGAIDALAAAIEESGATVELGTLPAIRGDKTLLHQLFQNLIGNGLKFRGERAPVIRLEARREGAGWLFSVADNGIGIEQEYLERIFLLFQRLHERTKYPGTGIGLAVCKKVVEHHGGRIWVESVPGEGSTFLFTIPDARPA